MTEKNDNILIYREIFKKDPELQENVFIAQRFYETAQFLKKTRDGLPKDEDSKNCFEMMINMCDIELRKQIEIIGTYVLKIMYDEMYGRDE